MINLRALAVLALVGAPVFPCSAFLVVGNGHVLFGNNEDYWSTETRVWFVPAQDDRRGVMYLGFDNGFPQGGMNDAGLAFDGFATGPRPMAKQEGKTVLAGNPITEVMETCTTVEQAIAYLEAVDLRPLLTNAMLFFADASGDSVIVEGDEFLRKEGDFQAITNFYQSAQDDDLAQCPRYAAAVRVLDAREEVSVDLCTRALSAAAQRGKRVATLYSNVFDLQQRTARLYLFHDFETSIEINLDEELSRGKRILKLPELFPRNEEWQEFVARQKRSVLERIEKRRGPELNEDVLEAHAGDYDLEYGGTKYRVVIRRERSDLVARCPELFTQTEGELRLHSATEEEFFMITETGEVDIRFTRDEKGATTAFTLKASGLELTGARVTEPGSNPLTWQEKP